MHKGKVQVYDVLVNWATYQCAEYSMHARLCCIHVPHLSVPMMYKHHVLTRPLHHCRLLPLHTQAVKQAARSSLIAPWSHTWVYRQLAALLATANILGLMCANLAGFVVGVEGLPDLITQVLGHPRMAAGTVLALFSAVQLMFALRQREAERKQQQQQRQQQYKQERLTGWGAGGVGSPSAQRASENGQYAGQRHAERHGWHTGSSQGPIMRKPGQGLTIRGQEQATPPSPPC
jgi:hypothetical protein